MKTKQYTIDDMKRATVRFIFANSGKERREAKRIIKSYNKHKEKITQVK